MPTMIDPFLVDWLSDLEDVTPWLAGFLDEYLSIAASERGFVTDSPTHAAARLLCVHKAMQSMTERDPHIARVM